MNNDPTRLLNKLTDASYTAGQGMSACGDPVVEREILEAIACLERAKQITISLHIKLKESSNVANNNCGVSCYCSGMARVDARVSACTLEHGKDTLADTGVDDTPKGYHRHTNGGGLVEDTAQVSDSAYVGKNARVSGKARIYDHARVSGDMWVYGSMEKKVANRIDLDPVGGGE